MLSSLLALAVCRSSLVETVVLAFLDTM